MNRRTFLTSISAAAAAAADHTEPVRITKIAFATIEGRFHRFVAMNAYDKAPKGHTYTNTLVRIFTDQGVEGAGVMDYSTPDAAFLKAVRQLVGANPLSVYSLKDGRITGRSQAFKALLSTYPHLDGPLFDLIGKLTKKPCYELLGGPIRDRVEVYDGTLYFSDIWFRDRGVRAVMEESEEAAKSGYRGLKYKIGRGNKWMEKEAGKARDLEVLVAARKTLGPDIKILADGNNGYQDDFEGVWRLIEGVKNLNMYWLEEMFPEDVALYGKLKDRMEKANIKILLADGENLSDPVKFAPYLKPRRLMDVLQMDIRRGGFLKNLEMARVGEEVGAISVPHNWGSQVGMFMGLHIAKAARSIPGAEDDRSTCDVLHAEGYDFRNGYYTVSSAPGLGIRVDEAVYRMKCKDRETVVS